MSVHLRKDGRWIVSYRDPETGRSRTKYFGAGLDNEHRAREWNESLGLNKYERSAAVPTTPLFAELADAYLRARVNDMADTTMDALLYKFAGVILPLIGDLRAQQVDRARLDRYVRDRLRQTMRVPMRNGNERILRDDLGRPRHPSRTTVHSELTYIQAVLNWAVEAGHIAYNPAARHRKPRRDDAVIMPPSAEEINRILANAPSHLVRAISLSYYTGLRPGRAELLGLRWSINHDADRRALLIVSAKKGGPDSRIVPIHDAFAGQLDAWRAADAAEGLDWMVHYRRRPVARLKKAWYATLRRAGITRRIRPYDIRHAFVTALLSGDADLKATSQIVGHADVSTTVRIYQHVLGGMHRRAIESLPALALPPGGGCQTKVVQKKQRKRQAK